MTLYLGCHLSTSAGYTAMGQMALGIDANTFAFFPRNPRGGSRKLPSEADIAGLRLIMQEHAFGPLVVHGPYTYNLCSATPKTIEFARQAMREDLELLEELPGNLYNFHPGSHVKQGADVGVRLIAHSLDEILFDGMHTTVLLETMAGKGTEVGRSFEELAAIIDACRFGDQLGICLDTCHVHDGGYEIAHDFDAVLDEFDRVLGLSRLKALHLNDSKNPCASHKDRHEKLGEGYLGLSFFRHVVHNKRVAELPMILETPHTSLDGYAAEIALLRGVA